MTVISAGPLIIVRVPTDREPAWRKILKALTVVMREHGLKRKDISGIEGVFPREEPESIFPEKDVSKERSRLDAAFNGGSRYASFWLYTWNRRGEKFVLARKPVEGKR
jgi:hypothetical protein